MPIVNKAPHLGIIRSTSIENTERETVTQNISKARKASYGLMSAGLHVENGLDTINDDNNNNNNNNNRLYFQRATHLATTYSVQANLP